MEQQVQPPQWPLKVLRFFLKKEYLEEIEGDMEECFSDNIEAHSLRKARWLYTWETAKLLRPALLKNLEAFQFLIHQAMFRNYFKISLRGMLKNPMNAFINIFGLTCAIGICVFAYAFANWTMSRDQFHEHKHEVYLATFFADRDGTTQEFGRAPRPLGEMLKQDFTHVNKMTRVEDRNVVMKYDDKVFHERIRFVDGPFLEMFTFPLKWGTTQSLHDVNSIILSEESSFKYFGDQNPVGQSVLVIFGKDNSKAFKITGVAKKFVASRSFSFDFLINFENLKVSDPGFDFNDWKQFVAATFIQVDDPADIDAIKQRMDKYRALQNEAVKQDWAINGFSFEPLATLHIRSEDIRDDIARSSSDNYASVIYLSAISLILLALACFNYINIAIVTAAKRLKEIGIRKSIGASRRLVIVQFLSENILITSFALVLGVAFGAFVFIPWFEGLYSFDMGFSLTDATLWMYLPAILLLTGVTSGIYPALYISNFQVVSIMKGSVKFGRSNPLTKALLVMQLIFACILINGGFTFTRNSDYLAHRSWGYNPHPILYTAVPDQASFEKLNAALLQNPNVISISGSADQLGKKNSTTVLHFPDREYEVDRYSVDATYFETMGLEFVAGRGFHKTDNSDKHAVVVTDLLVKNLAWTNPLGQVFQIDSVEYEVVGVVKNFHSYSFSRQVKPIIFSVSSKEDFRYLSVKVREGSEQETFKALQAHWISFFPEVPFQGGHQEDVWGFYFEEIGIHGKMWRAFASIAVLLAGLGLYGLITLNVAGRTKEFSIRKVLGAGVKNITIKVADQYLVLFAVALAIGAPLSYFLVNVLIDTAYAYHMPIDSVSVIMTVVFLVFVLAVTVSTQIRKVVKANAVDGLKVE